MKLNRTFHFNPVLFTCVPLVNVLFLVVVFYALSNRFVLQPGLAVALPGSAFTLAPQHNAQIVSVTAAPVPAIYFQNQKMTMQEFGHRLAQVHTRDRSLIIKADQHAPHGIIVELTNRGLEQGFSVIHATSSEAP